jgi:hypothetical protein
MILSFLPILLTPLSASEGVKCRLIEKNDVIRTMQRLIRQIVMKSRVSNDLSMNETKELTINTIHSVTMRLLTEVLNRKISIDKEINKPKRKNSVVNICGINSYRITNNNKLIARTKNMITTSCFSYH